jgi:phosphohistidine phosphatase
LEPLLPAFGKGVEVRLEDGLYGAPARDLLVRIGAVDSAVDVLLVVGHNPGLQDLAIDLAGDGDPEALEQLRAKFPTGALATLDVDLANWQELGPARAFLARLLTPKVLAARRPGET